MRKYLASLGLGLGLILALGGASIVVNNLPFDSATFSFTGGAVAIKAGGVAQTMLPSGYAAPTAHGVVVGEGTSAPVAVGPCGTAGQILGYPTTAADPACVSTRTPIGWAVASQAQNTTQVDYIGLTNPVAGARFGNVAAFAGTLRELRVTVNNAPASGQTYTATVYNGTTATALTCQIANPATSCADTTNSAAVSAGDVWGIQMVTSATSGSTGPIGVGVEFDTP